MGIIALETDFHDDVNADPRPRAAWWARALRREG